MGRKLPPATANVETTRQALLELVMSAHDDTKHWFPNVAGDLVHDILGLVGEAGEIANKTKKYRRGSLTHGEYLEVLRDELADVFTYFLCVYSDIGGDILEDYLTKRQFNEERFGHE